jgi:actin cytoskeleton-regulatory complex protein SLA1
MQPLQAQLTGYSGPMMQSHIAPLGQSMQELSQQRQLQAQQQQLMSQQTGMGYGNFQPLYQQPQQTGMPGFQQPSLQQALVNGQQTGSPFADPVNQYQPMMSMQTGMGMPMYLQQQRTGVNAFLPPALMPQLTGMQPQQTGMPNQYGLSGQAPPVPPLPQNLASIPIPPIPQQQQIPAPLVPQRTGPAPPVRFGVQKDAPKLVPQPTGKRANLAAASEFF